MPGYQFYSTQLSDRVKRYSLLEDGQAVSLTSALQAMNSDEQFCGLFSDTIAECPFQAGRFETPASTTSTLDKQFEFVLVDSPSLSLTADPSSFTKHFEASAPGQRVIAFANLRGDATMIVPKPIDQSLSYTHLLDFLRNAPKLQVRELWKTVSDAMLEEISESPIWLSTAGGGVPWLHVRLDSRPKYYSYQPYTADPI